MSGVQPHEFIGVITHRTNEKLLSVSWKNRFMAMLIPIGRGHEDNPDFTVPIQNGFIGSFQFDKVADSKVKEIEHNWQENPNGFETTATLQTGDSLKQTVKIISLGEKAVLYEDQVIALAEVSITKELGVPIGIENDQITGGKRIVYSQAGQTVFDWQKPQPPVAITGSWANVDGRLGAVMIEGAGMSYLQAKNYTPGISVQTDILHASFSTQPRHYKQGDVVARRVALFMVETSAKATAAVARSIQVENKPDGKILHFKLPGSGSTCRAAVVKDVLVSTSDPASA